MGNDLEIIKRLGEKFRTKLRKLTTKEFMNGDDNGYVVDWYDNILALKLKGLGFTNISCIEGLTALRHLNLSNNQIIDISVVKTFTALEKLYLNSNLIRDISAIKGLTAVTSLDLSNNQVMDISAIKGLTVLKHLDLSNNLITDISAVKGLKRLSSLSLKNNRVLQLPEELLGLGLDIEWYSRSNCICLLDNPLEMPPVEIVRQGNWAIRNYFKELKSKKTVRFLEAKLLIVGNGEVGKTTLLKKLKDNNFQIEIGKEPTTHGINIQPWQLPCPFNKDCTEDVKIHFWDFGGQDIYHATHQFFLTKRSLYLFVWEARKEEESRSFDYWLNIIKLLSDNSPVIVIMNKSDVRIKHIDEATFKDKFKNIVTFIQVSCFTGKGIPDLTEQIKTALGDMPHLRDQLPEVWLKIRDRLNSENKNYIPLDEYFEICREFGLDAERADFLSLYLHDLGIILHYRHDRLLENTVILNPEWATEAVYKLIDTRTVQENKGRFIFDDLKIIWDEETYPRDKHAQLMRLMEKFELCFNVTGTHIHIIPELLPSQRPAIDFDVYRAPGSLQFLYQYDFMPEGIISRFISRNYYFIRNEHFWKTGAELTFEDSRALVMSDILNHKMKISVTGSMKGELLAIIRKEMEHIHQTLNLRKEENYHEMLPCTCSQCRESEDPHLYQYKVLKDFSSKGFPLHCPSGLEPVTIKQLLKGYTKQKPRHGLKEELIRTASQLMGLAETIKEDEDSRNGFISLILEIKGFTVKDQTRWGRSASGKSMGEIDIKVELPKDGYALCEAFRLHGFNKNVIDGHLTKLFNYDASGVKENFIIVYAETDDFTGLWEKYLDRIPKIDFKNCPLYGDVEEETVDTYANIKLARARHMIEKRGCDVYHLFVKMPLPRGR